MIVLASNSPRRRELLALGGWQYSVLPAHVDESVLPDDSARGYVLRTSLRKARAAQRLMSAGVGAERFIVACDTAVVDGSDILGKPSDSAQAREMLLRLRGRVHQVYSALSIMNLEDGAIDQDVCVTDVPMRNYSDDEMKTYVASGDPMDKAGAYAIQHPGFKPVLDMQGCYANVMGLPLCHLTRSMKKLGVDPEKDIPQACQDELDFTCPVYNRILNGEL